MDSTKKVLGPGFMVTLMALYFVVPSMGAVLAALADMGAAFPSVDPAMLGYMASIVSVGQIIAAVVAGAIVGKMVKYKTLLIISLLLFLVAGVAPYFFPDGTAGGSFELILVTRFIFGLGLGCFKPIAEALIANAYDDENKRANVFGFGNSVFNIGAIVFQMAGGFLCLISWQTTFLIYLLGLIPLIAVLVAFKEPEFGTVAENKPKQKVKIPVMIWLLFIMFLATQVFQYPTFVYLSQFMAEVNLGDSAIAGTLLSVITAAGIVIALVFGVIYRALGKFTLPVSAFLVAAGEGLIYLSCTTVSLPIMIAAVVVFGIGATIMMAALSQEVSRLVNKATAGVALGLLFAFMNVGTFAATPYTQAIASGGSLLATMVVGPIALVVVGIIFAVITFTAKPEAKVEE